MLGELTAVTFVLVSVLVLGQELSERISFVIFILLLFLALLSYLFAYLFRCLIDQACFRLEEVDVELLAKILLLSLYLLLDSILESVHELVFGLRDSFGSEVLGEPAGQIVLDRLQERERLVNSCLLENVVLIDHAQGNVDLLR